MDKLIGVEHGLYRQISCASRNISGIGSSRGVRMDSGGLEFQKLDKIMSSKLFLVSWRIECYAY
jgi:hypothetical protein